MSNVPPSGKGEPPTDPNFPTGKVICPMCGQENRPGSLLCVHCGRMLTGVIYTRKLALPAEQTKPVEQPSADDLVSATRPITFEIDDQKFSMTIAESIIFGRQSDFPEEPQPDVDLTPYGAHEKGVSRRHLRIKRKDSHLYATDIGSSNGSWLNGHRLTVYGEYPIRNSDELRLGLMRIKVRF